MGRFARGGGCAKRLVWRGVGRSAPARVELKRWVGDRGGQPEGRCGKTTTAINFGRRIRARGARHAARRSRPAGQCDDGRRCPAGGRRGDARSTSALLGGRVAGEVVHQTSVDRLTSSPATRDLVGAGDRARERCPRRESIRLRMARLARDRASRTPSSIIDRPPSLSLLTLNAPRRRPTPSWSRSSAEGTTRSKGSRRSSTPSAACATRSIRRWRSRGFVLTMFDEPEQPPRARSSTRSAGPTSGATRCSRAPSSRATCAALRGPEPRACRVLVYDPIIAGRGRVPRARTSEIAALQPAELAEHPAPALDR